MCKNANGSKSMDSMMAEHQRFLEECERRLQEAKATSRANREAIEKIAQDIEKMTTEVTTMNTMAHENRKTMQDGELERTINAESTQPCADDDYLKEEWEDYPEDLDEWDDYPEDPDEWEDYPEDPDEWEDYPEDLDEWEDYPEDPDEWEDYPEDPDMWEDYPEDSYEWDDYRDDLEDSDEWYDPDEWYDLCEHPNDLDIYFDGEFSPAKTGIYTAWRDHEYVSDISRLKVRNASNRIAEVTVEESNDPLWDCWYDVAMCCEPDSEKFAREEAEDIYREIYEEIFDMAGITIEDFLADEIYLCDKLIQRGQVAERRKKTYWHGQHLRKNAIIMWKSYTSREDCSHCFKKNGRMVRNDGQMWNRTQSIITKALKKKVISFS